MTLRRINRKPDPQLIDELRGLLTMAEEGKLLSLLWLGESADGELAYGVHKAEATCIHRLLGYVAFVQMRVMMLFLSDDLVEEG